MNVEQRQTQYEILTSAEHQRIEAYLDLSFGIDKSALANFTFFRWGKKKIFACNRDLTIPPGPKVFGFGLPVLHVYGDEYRISSIGAMSFGNNARRNVIALERTDLEKFYNREVFFSSPDRQTNCTGDNYVILTYAGQVVGLGFLSASGQVASLVPKGWIS